ncbi:hypothetical protein HNP37_001936 [Flavobacterium nitrogenifigens]|uniref:DUF4386 domain-containing protein n=2 Tax=Flavobacterium TaxID=237 RepID=A0A7W7N6I8_9FLAO|nr:MULTISPECIES: DUF4386 domain-containing protein [Flavobacterium]MBB4801875.1 hypothetical protein [Flavobacterium nitrogenifigens]MBB6386833.1 hypothetical protein [Flavobacterium notoginsengisoli]
MNFKPVKFESSPQMYARIAGLLYLVIIVMGACSQAFVRNKLYVSGDAIATANNIIQNPFLWKIGITADLIMHICDLPVMIILYYFLKPVSKKLALLNLSFNLIQTAILVLNKLNLLTALFFLSDVDYLKSFSTEQLAGLSYLSIKVHNFGFGIGLIFFGFVCLFEGYLIFKSDYFPKAIGILMAIAGFCYLFNSFALILEPELSHIMLLMPCLIAELSFSLWLVFKGVKLEIWKQKCI